MGRIYNAVMKQEDLQRNTRTRVTICLCIDTSMSMGLSRRMERVNQGVQKLIRESQNDICAAGAVELCIVTFGGTPKVHQPFANVRDIRYQDFRPGGGTRMGEGVRLALREIDRRQEEFKNHGIASFKPWLVIMSDGGTDDDITDAVQEVRARLQAREIKLQCVNMNMEDREAAETLERFSPDGSVETIGAMEIDTFFDQLSRSAAGLSMELPGNDQDAT